MIFTLVAKERVYLAMYYHHMSFQGAFEGICILAKFAFAFVWITITSIQQQASDGTEELSNLIISVKVKGIGNKTNLERNFFSRQF